ncbi:SpaA isopeptide-forming pilin-related protein [Luteolibacter arcticus]|uniref:SpaA isopeptide-forming pilin-related protein n=1 Tax=Luteolibacter arcticus TaxID=1581411 RepID=A0ABT3GQQ8_9BACT|nr:SdrD B-like domain-containing protein [Luteolibacter arcticus]MCW1925853.1 SpaA isopeptide-forming pilin-related protein [Luteolibacter arcticus]
MFLPAVPTVRRFVLGFVGALLCAGGAAHAVNPPPTQLFYVPFPEDHQLSAFDSINSVANDPITVFVTLAAATDGTVIYYDHWEDGYERDITDPVQSTTLVFGDGNAANGYPPGNPADLIPAGTVFNLRNFVATATLQAVVDYDGRDKIASFKPISVTKTTVPAGTDTLLAGCVEVFERGLWGNEYRSPVGIDMPQTTPTATLTQDENLFSYAALAISAGPGGASVQVDKDNNGVFEETVLLAEGEAIFRSDVNVGGHVLADKPVQVVLFTGTVGSTYASRDTSLLPTYRWSSDYFAPVSTRTSPTDGTVTFLYNPGAAAITVNYDYRSSATAYTTATISVPAKGNARVALQPANGTNHFGAYRFYTTGVTPPVFYAMSAIDADAASGSNQNWDGGFTLVGRPSLTTQVLLSLGIGRDPYSAVSPGENGNPLWITTSGNGHTQETVYVDYNGDNVGPLTDPNGNHYDVGHSLRELEQLKIFDPDGDQSGMLVYTLNPSVRIAAAWGQDPAVATVAQPGLDVASLVPPMREGDGGKRSSIAVDADGDGAVSCGDTLEYDIRGISNARTNIPGPFAVQDNLPSTVTYVPGTTRYRFMVGGAWQAWTAIPDNGTGTAFPLDVAGFSVPGNLASGQQFQVVFRATIVPRESLTGATIENTGQVEISPYGLLLPLSWTDTVYGSIGDRVWGDLDGDGIQDPGENGIPNIDVHLDLDNDGIRDAGEPVDITDASGNYLFAGLSAGNYVVRVDPADIAAANVGYGPTYDLDGIATSHRASVTLGIAEDRVDADFGYRVGASVGDRVWIDRDNDGVQENGEPGINGVRVYLDTDNDNTYDAGEPNTTTSGDGLWYIGNLNPGTYAVRVDTSTLPVSATQTFDLNGGLDHEASVTLLGAEHRATLDFGYRGPYSIGDLVWEDVNADGISSVSTVRNVYNALIDISQNNSGGNEDDGSFAGYVVSNGRIDVSGNGSIGNEDDGTLFGVSIVNGYFDLSGNGSNGNDDDGAVTHTVSEAAIANVRVYLDMDGDGVFDATEPSAVTNASGAYSIGNLFNGTYVVRVDTSTLPSSYVQTYDLTSPSTDHTASVTISGANRTDADFGYRNDASLGDLVWNDRDADGIRDAGEPGIPGVWVYIDSDGDNAFDQGIERFTITDLAGFYRFENLAAGSYNVRVEFSTLPQGSTQTHDLNGELDHEASRTLTTSQEATDVDFGYRSNAAFGDRVWNDSNGNGILDGVETGIANVRVYVDINGNGTFDSATEPSALTDSGGAYSIGNLVPGTYTARIDVGTLPANMTQTYDANGGLDHAATFSLSANQTRDEIDYGYTLPVSIGDLVWNDLDGDGQKDTGESGLAGVTLTLYRSNDTIAGTATTNASGLYSFTGLMPGSYYVIFDPVAGYLRSLADQGADASDSDANAAGRTHTVTLTGGQSDLTLDAGYFQPGTITGSVLADTNNDNTGDLPLAGVVVTLKDGSGNDIDSDPNTGGVQPTTATTNGSGAYTFSNLTPGSYQVVETQPAGYLTVTDGDTTTPGDDAANASTTDNMIPVAVAANETDTGNNFIEEQPGIISGTVYADTNNDNTGEVGIVGVTLTLFTDPNADGNPADGAAFGSPILTGVGGIYSFTNLPPGAYVVVETQPSGYLTVTDGDTTTPGDDATNASTTDNRIPAAVIANETDGGNDFVEEQPAIISGTIWADTNNDNIGDVGIAGVTLTLYTDPNADGNQADGAVYGSAIVTGVGGTYSFTNLPPGSYVVVETQPSGYLTVTDGDTSTPGDDVANASTTDNRIPVSVAANETDNGNDFIEEQPGVISGTVWADTNNDNVGDVGIVGVTLTLFTDPNGDGNQADGAAYGSAIVTGTGGTYSFTNLPPGAYVVVETQPSGYLTVTDGDTTTPGDDAANASTSDDRIPVAVSANETDDGNNFVEEQPGIISGTVWADTNNDNGGDVGIAGVSIALFTDPNADGNPADGVQFGSSVLTLTGGTYSFTNLPPGAYVVVETQPSGYLTVTDGDTTTPGDDAANSSTTDNRIPVAVAANETDNGNDFIEEQPGIISGTVWADTNNDNVGDVGIAGVSIALFTDPNADGNPADGVAYGSPFVTLTGGAYSFTNLPPGAYVVVETQPSGYLTVTDGDTTTPGDDAANASTTDNRIPVAVSANETDDGNNFVEEQPGIISGTVWADLNNDNVGDVGIAGVTLTLYTDPNADGNQADGVAYGSPFVTLTGGAYSFTNLPPGAYVVVETQPSGYLTVIDGDTTTPGDDAANSSTTDDRIPVAVAANETDNGNDFIEEQPGTISGTVWADTNNDNVGDVGIAGVSIALYTDPNADGNPADGVQVGSSVITLTGGTYSFTNLPPGAYVVVETQPFGYLTVTDGDTTTPGDDAANSSTTDNRIPVAVAANETDNGNDFVEEQPGTISGTVWADTNNDNAGDVGISGVTIALFTDPNADGNPADGVQFGSSVITLTGGTYSFTNLPPGAYVVVETQPAGYLTVTDGDTTTPGDDVTNASTTDDRIPVAVAANETDNGNDFVEEQPGTISGTVWADTNNDNAGDVGIAGVSIALFTDPNADGNPTDGVQIGSSVLTFTGGTYSFTNLAPGAYVVVQTQPSGYLTVTDGDATTPGDDAINASTTDDRIPVAVSANEADNGNDFVEQQPGTISGTVWADTNNDNVGDVGIAGVTIALFTDPNGDGNQADGVAYGSPFVTLTGGTYSFTNLPPGAYVVVETQPSGYFTVTDGDTTTPGDDSTNASTTDNRIPVAVSADETDNGNDFVEEQPGSISGSVFADTDGDGDGDAPLENVLIRLLDGAGIPVDGVTTLTLADGSYSIGGLAPGNYRVSEDQPAGYNSVNDTDGANNNVIGEETAIAVTAGGTSGGHDFIEIEPASITGHVFADSDNNGSGDTPLAGITLTLRDGSGTPITTTVTLPDGSYLFANLPPGTYRVSQSQPAGYASVSDVDGANNNLIGDETPIVLLPGDDVTGRDFVEVEYGSIAGSVFDDSDDDGSGDTPIAGVTLSLLDGAGQPVLDGLNQPITTVTGANGSYLFANLLPGSYQVAETQPTGYGSVSDVDGGNLDFIGNLTAIAVAPGQDVTGRDFVEIRLGAISGFVYAGTDPLAGVTLALLDEHGDPVLDGNGDPITTITGPDGSYSFTGVFPGTYQVGQVQPDGYDSFSDADGGDNNLIGDVRPIVVLPGETNEDNNFIETLDTCSNDWPEWLELHPGENASGNPDADVLDNLAEFAFAQPYDSGAGDPFCISPSETAPGTIEGKFIRPKQATDHVTYILEYASALGTPTTWHPIVLQPDDLIVTDNGDCTETVVIFDLENLTGLTGGEGFVRIRAELDEDGDDTTDHTSFTATEGWTRTPVDICCRTYNNPYLRCAAFTGTVDSATGSEIELVTSSGPVDLATLLQPGVSYYAEMTSGENEGHRFDVVSATGSTLTVANDLELTTGDAPFNTLIGGLPVSLAGDGIVIRRHWTLDELFPPTEFGATGSQSTADQVQVSSAGVWTIYWLYDDSGTPRWVKDATLTDQGAAVIPPGQGMFFNSRHTTGTVLSWGQVRPNKFIRPLAKGASLVGGGYPIDQKPMVLTGSRAMTLGQGFFGSRDFKKADRFYVWRGDAVALETGYTGYFLLHGAPVQPALIQWTKTGDTTIQSHNDNVLFLGDRAVFMDLANDIFTYQILTPWTP